MINIPHRLDVWVSSELRTALSMKMTNKLYATRVFYFVAFYKKGY